MWTAFDEAHVTTIAVDEPWRGRGLGELLLAALYDEAARRGANWLTLEVRVSNESAQALYRKWGFTVQGTRRRYYSDNNEDAYIMWSKAIGDPAYREQVVRLRRAVLERMPVPVVGFPDEPPAPVAVRPSGKPPWDV
jgi:ribosomal-protein-alanine N-acetyltransferase